MLECVHKLIMAYIRDYFYVRYILAHGDNINSIWPHVLGCNERKKNLNLNH